MNRSCTCQVTQQSFNTGCVPIERRPDNDGVLCDGVPGLVGARLLRLSSVVSILVQSVIATKCLTSIASGQGSNIEKLSAVDMDHLELKTPPGRELEQHEDPSRAPTRSNGTSRVCDKKSRSGCRFIPLRKSCEYETDGAMEPSSSVGQVSSSEERTRKEFSQVPALPFSNRTDGAQ